MPHLWYTDGPSSSSRVQELLNAGATGARLTFSYATPEYHSARAFQLKQIGRQLGLECTVVADLAGEKFRLGDFGTVTHFDCFAGQRIRFVLGALADPHCVTPDAIPVRDPAFFRSLAEGTEVVVGDGSANLRTLRAETETALLEVLSDGSIQKNRGLTVVGSSFQPKSLTEKDLADLVWVLRSDIFDAVAVSFVQGPDDVDTVKAMARQHGRNILVVAKIETPKGVENVERIARAADYLMAARGDLALTMPWPELPHAVMAIAQAATANSRPWILATQIAEGLEHFSLPTRAEICDLARWMSEGCSGVLLSFETVFGSHPVEAVAATRRLMDRWSVVTVRSSVGP